MQTPVYKAVAMPPRVFWAPMFPVMINFVMHMAILVLVMGAFPGQVNPDTFILTFLIVHVGLILWGQKEPHLSRILMAQNMVWTHWTKDRDLKRDEHLIPAVSGDYTVRYKEGVLACVFRFNKATAGMTNWGQWLADLSQSGVSVRVVVSNTEQTHVILSVREEKRTHLEDAAQGVQSVLRDFEPVLMTGSEAKEFLEKELRGDVHFSKNHKSLIVRNHQAYMTSVGITAPGDQMDTRMFEEILALEHEIKIQHGIEVIPNARALPLLIQQRKMSYFTTFSQNVYNQYTDVLEKLSSFQDFPEVLCHYAISIFVTGRSVAEINQIAKKISAILDKYHFKSVGDGNLTQATFLTQFPVCSKYPRLFLCPSETVAVALSTVKPKEEKYKWGTTF